MKKVKSHAFGKDVFLLGEDYFGTWIWLEAPSFDCNWYWGFGYVEEYTNHKRPDVSRDISSHSHWDSAIKSANNSELWNKTVWTTEEGEQLDVLFKKFYELKEEAETAHRIDMEVFKNLNNNAIPHVMNQIICILSPEGVWEGYSNSRNKVN